MNSDAALLLVDVQNDFCPGGALPVPEGSRVAAPLSLVASCFAAVGLAVIASRDWHPAETSHFSEFGGSWPPHCIKNTPGAAFHPDLHLPGTAVIVSKGSGSDEDSYSAFDGRSEDGRTLNDLLTALKVRTLYVGGLATDYCVRASVLDAVRAGYEVTVLEDAVAGVDVKRGDSEKALAEMRAAGASFCKTDEVVLRVQANPDQAPW